MSSYNFLLDSGDERSEIILNPGLPEPSLLPSGKKYIITDQNVNELYCKLFGDDSDIIIFSIDPGESNKTIDTVLQSYSFLLENGADRHSYIIGFGGGVVCDIAGFVASTYMRGTNLIMIPTTLLSMVDASIGGKNGVNFIESGKMIKNLAGNFKLPEKVMIFPEFLSTLPNNELINGFAEIIKIAIVGDDLLFRELSGTDYKTIMDNPNKLNEIIFRAVKLKSRIVGNDLKDKGIRKILNLGHTFGHALESLYDLPHGKAVSIGIAKAADLSLNLGKIKGEDCTQIKNTLISYDLPVEYDYSISDIVELIKSDKKTNSGKIDYIMIESIGRASTRKSDIDELFEIYR